MKKESLKTLILFLLVFCSILLTINMWFSEKLWPDGYNFFANLKMFNINNTEFKSTLTKDSIALPKNVVVTNVSKRSMYGMDSEEFEKVSVIVRDIIKSALNNHEFSQATVEDWNTALKSKSFYASYPVAYDYKVFSSVLGATQTNLNIKSIKDFVIYLGNSISSDIIVYIKDFTTSEITKVSVKWEDRKQIDSLLSQYSRDPIGNISFSFELNFDKPSSDGVTQEVVIAPETIIILSGKSMPVIQETNVIFQDDKYDFGMIDILLKGFGYNTSNYRKYIESDNSIVYVENYDSIRIHQDGLIEYKSVDNQKGIPTVKSSNDSAYEILLSCVDFVNNLWEQSIPNKKLNINLSSDIIDIKNKSFKIYMDYYVDGTEINCTLDKTDSHESMSHAIEIEVVDSKIVSYRQILKYFVPTAQLYECSSVINALDILFDERAHDSDIVSDIFITYTSNKGGLWIPSWAAKIGSNTTDIIGD